MSSFAQLQPPKIYRIGFLSLRSRPVSMDTDFYGGFVRGMRELGYVEGKNVVFEWRFADANPERLAMLAAELVQLNVDIIVAAGVATGAAQKASKTIPIVMGAVGDPVGRGYVASLAQPGGNITGLSNFAGDLGPKHLEMLVKVIPRLTRAAVLTTNTVTTGSIENIRAAAQKSNIRILRAEVRSVSDLDDAFATMTRESSEGMIIGVSPLFVEHGRRIAELALKNRLPSIAPNREYAQSGGLMSYGQNQAESYRRAATYVDKILKGAKPSNLPVEQPTKLELFINQVTAKKLGLPIPQSLLIGADTVIE